jgi:hypothetical protein
MNSAPLILPDEDEGQNSTLRDESRRLMSAEEGSVIEVYDAKHHTIFYVDEHFWIHLSWPLELVRRLVTYKYTIPVFDIVYVGMVIFYTIRYVRFYADNFNHHDFNFNRSTDCAFFIFFALETVLNAFAPPFTLRLMRDIFTDETIPVVVETAMSCDKYFHLKMCTISYFNTIGILAIVLLSVSVIDFYDEATSPFIILYSFPLAGVVSVVVVLLDAYRLLQVDFIERMQLTPSTPNADASVTQDPTGPQNRFSFASQQPLNTLEYHTRDTLALHAIMMRLRFAALHKELYTAGQRWGLTLLLLICGLAMYAMYLVILAYKLEDVSLVALLPYVVTALFALGEIVISLSLVNETGTKVKKELAKHVLNYAGHKSLACDCQDLSILLTCAQTLPLEIHFVEGFSLKFKLAAAILSPIVFAMLPRLISL